MTTMPGWVMAGTDRHVTANFGGTFERKPYTKRYVDVKIVG